MTASVTVVVPYRPDRGQRDRVWTYVQHWWRTHHPDWSLVRGFHGTSWESLQGLPEPADAPDPGPWVKAWAVASAVQGIAPTDLLVIADADLICYGLDRAVQAVDAGIAPWAVPHRRVQRLTEQATQVVLDGGDLPAPPSAQLRSTHRPRAMDPTLEITESHNGTVGGGLVVLPWELYQVCPLDPRFQGWGQEDASWGLALTTLAGHPWRGTADAWHLWHPPAQRLRRAVGSVESLALLRRYRAANTPDKVKSLLAEIVR